ncbi:MAG: GDSL-type esterase/lipase family protein [Patescibacteria group bacterium]
MSANKTPSSFGGEWLDKLSDLFSDTDKNLDQVKKSIQDDLKELRKSGELESLSASLYLSAENGFKKDLEEIGITGEAQKEYLALFKESWQKQEMGKKSSEILNSPELAAMDGFLSHVENLPKLKEVIESAEPESKWKSMLTSYFPGIDKYLEGLAPFLSSIGLGFLVKKGGEKKTEDKKPEETKKPDEEKKEGEKTDNKKPEGPLDGPEAVPENFKPPKTLLLGDSNPAVLGDPMHKNLKNKLNITDMIAKGGEQSRWGLSQVKAKPKDYFKDFEYAVIEFGSNDLGSEDSAETIWGRLQEIATIIKNNNPKIKICVATIPPCKGNPYGQWGTNFGGTEKRRTELNALIRKAKKDGQIDEVMDLAAKKSEGGLADDSDPSGMAKDYWRHGDKVHADAKVLATAIHRTQYRTQTQTA